MIERAAIDWRKEFGVDERMPPAFFANKNQLTPAVQQAHVLRRAFDLLNLDGIFCAQNVPLVYFKQVMNITPALVHSLHSQFWNHGGAPILVLISTDKIHIYSSMSRPVSLDQIQQEAPSLVTVLDRATEGLREFLVSVESGDFFRRHASSFNPDHRIDRDLLRNLKDTRDILDEITNRKIAPQTLDALLCRLVFTCYLFDREVIGESYLQTLKLKKLSHLRDVLKLEPPKDAKAALYRLFTALRRDFNGDLFNDDLEIEERQITQRHIETLSEFFQGTVVRTGQLAFWPYDFAAIPIETISAIYEHFLKASDQKAGAFYTPRFLAEVVLDNALQEVGPLMGKRFLDPACGSGIFLVALFNRMAEEWRYANPTARNNRRARELMQLLQGSFFGVDISPTACRITAFSLYLAYLDQLSPRDIQDLQKRGGALPRLVASGALKSSHNGRGGNIQCIDFFSSDRPIVKNVDLVVGNPPWGSIAADGTLPSRWCQEHKKPLPDKQIATAFVWKAVEHISETGRVCFVLPHGTLFNHNTTAVEFQKAWLTQHSIKRVLNLADFRLFLFEKAIHPAIVVSYGKKKPAKESRTIDYWAPKADWSATQAEIISIAPMDRSVISVDEVLRDLNGPDAPQTWKQHFWGTPRDLRLLDRLSLYPRLRDHIRASRDTSDKPWLMAEGFQPVGENDDPEEAKILRLPSRHFISATSADIDLFLLQQDTQKLPTTSVSVRGRSNKNIDVFRAPHVLITKGFQRVAFSDFDVSFRHAVRGIHGPKKHRDLLIFLAAYLRTSLAQYFIFHTAASWGMYRPEIHVEEVLRLPMPFPEELPNPERANAIVNKVATIVQKCAEDVENSFLGRVQAIQNTSDEIEPLVAEYFDIQPLEKLLIADTLNIVIPSVQPTQSRMPVPTVKPSSGKQREAYKDRVCDVLNGWAKKGQAVRGKTISSDASGIGIALLENVSAPHPAASIIDADLLASLSRVHQLATLTNSVVEVARGLMIFDKNKLYIVKPIGQRYWTDTAALNDADEIAGTILMHSHKA